MANKRFNFTFEDGYEYEVTVYEGGGICIKNDIGGKILELGRWRMLDVLEILDSVRDDLKAANERYHNPIVKKEVERMELDETEIVGVMVGTIRDYMCDKVLFEGWADDEKDVLRYLLIKFCYKAVNNLMDAETAKLDRMAEEEVEE